MDTVKLQLFLAAAEFRNLTKAAEQLGYTQSGASHMLSSLEKELGAVQLFSRERNGLELTTHGERLLEYAREILYWTKQLQDAAATISNTQTGMIRVAGFVSVLNPWLPPIRKRFQSKHPEIEFQVMYSCYDDIESWLLTGQADCAFVRIPAHKSIRITFLKSDPMFAVMPTGHPLSEKTMLTYDDLQKQTFIRTIGDRYSDVAPIIESRDFGLKFPYYMHNYQSVLEAVSKGAGISIVPDLVIRHYKIPGICIRPFQENPVRNIGIGTRPADQTPVVKEFVSVAQQVFYEENLQ